MELVGHGNIRVVVYMNSDHDLHYIQRWDNKMQQKSIWMEPRYPKWRTYLGGTRHLSESHQSPPLTPCPPPHPELWFSQHTFGCSSEWEWRGLLLARGALLGFALGKRHACHTQTTTVCGQNPKPLDQVSQYAHKTLRVHTKGVMDAHKTLGRLLRFNDGYTENPKATHKVQEVPTS